MRPGARLCAPNVSSGPVQRNLTEGGQCTRGTLVGKCRTRVESEDFVGDP